MRPTVDDLKALMLQTGIDSALINSLDPTVPLAAQGFDSIDYPTFAVALEERYKVSISDTDSLRLRTLQDFVDFVATATA